MSSKGASRANTTSGRRGGGSGRSKSDFPHTDVVVRILPDGRVLVSWLTGELLDVAAELDRDNLYIRRLARGATLRKG